MIILIVCRRLGFWTDWRLKGKKRRRGFLPGAPCYGSATGWQWGDEAYLLHRVSCTVLGAASTPGGGDGGVWTSGAEKGRCGAGQHSFHPRLLPRRCYSCHHPQPPHSLPDLSPEKFYHLSGKESRHKSSTVRHTRESKMPQAHTLTP